ncbi:hypothetical protein KJ766_01345, partial [Patescibacteria group bacterium]|nr:hypothetical protein [Patescibacteria group bacterium]
LEIKLTRKSVNISATEKISEIIWKSGDRLAFINLSGEFVRDLKDFEIAQIYARPSIPTTYSYNGEESLPLQPTMPIVEDLSQEVLSSESKILGKVQPENLTVFDSSLRLIGVMPVIYQIENREAAWVRVKSDQQYDILLDCSGEVGGQLSALETVLDDYSESLDSISYIDVRFGNHVYVK